MKWTIVNSMLIVSVMSTALFVIYTKHYNRMLYVELHAENKHRDDLLIEWDKLQLEQSTLATHKRVEYVAKHRLNMRNLDFNEVYVVSP